MDRRPSSPPPHSWPKSSAKAQLMLRRLGIIPREVVPDRHGSRVRRLTGGQVAEILLEICVEGEDLRQRFLVGGHLGILPRQPFRDVQGLAELCSSLLEACLTPEQTAQTAVDFGELQPIRG